MGLNLSSLWNVTMPEENLAQITSLDVQERVNASLDIARDYIEVGLSEHCTNQRHANVLDKWHCRGPCIASLRVYPARP